MLATLLKKEFAGMFKRMLYRQTDGRSKKKVVLTTVFIALLLLYCVLAIAIFSYMLFSELITSVIEQNGNTWFYFAFLACFATLFALIGTAFIAQAQLYKAKDNDLLLSLPIKISYIIISRIAPLFVMNLAFILVVVIPGFVAYCIHAGTTFMSVIGFTLVTLAIGFFSLAISCAIGRLLAIISSKAKRSTLASTIAALVLFVLYFLIMTKVRDLIPIILENCISLEIITKKYLPTLYFTGLAMTGKSLPILISVLINGGVFALVFIILSRTYIKTVTTSVNNGKSVYKNKKLRTSSLMGALINKEWQRFSRCSLYFVNCTLGCVIILAACVLSIIKRGTILEVLNGLGELKGNFIAPMVLAVVLVSVGTNCVTAPSLSLEGKMLWILKSLPIDPKLIAYAKIILHLIINAPFAILGTIVLGIVFNNNPLSIVFSVILCILFVAVTGAFGLKRNYKNPDFDWTNESQPIKQSINILISMFFGFFLAIITFGAVAGLSMLMPDFLAIFIVCLVFGGILALYIKWFNNAGAKLFKQFKA